MALQRFGDFVSASAAGREQQSAIVGNLYGALCFDHLCQAAEILRLIKSVTP
jgi:hypothetical protein